MGPKQVIKGKIAAAASDCTIGSEGFQRVGNQESDLKPSHV